MANKNKSLVEELFEQCTDLSCYARLYRDKKIRKLIINQLKLVRTGILKSNDKELIKILKNYYLDMPLSIFWLRLKLNVPPLLGLVIVILSAGATRNAYIYQYLILQGIFVIITIGGAFVIVYFAVCKGNTAKRIENFAEETIKVLQRKR